MLQALSYCDRQADSFAAQVLHDRIVLEREAVRLEEDRLQREAQERIKGHESETIRRSDD